MLAQSADATHLGGVSRRRCAAGTRRRCCFLLPACCQVLRPAGGRAICVAHCGRRRSAAARHPAAAALSDFEGRGSAHLADQCIPAKPLFYKSKAAFGSSGLLERETHDRVLT